MIYFIQDSRDGRIKIGLSNNPWSRLISLNTGSPAPMTLLAVMPGKIERERDLHKQFGHLRIAREWFRAEPDLLAFIKKATAEHPQERPRKAPPRPPPVVRDEDDDLIEQMSHPFFWSQLETSYQRMMRLKADLNAPDLLVKLLNAIDIPAEMATLKARLTFLELLDRCRKQFVELNSDAFMWPDERSGDAAERVKEAAE